MRRLLELMVKNMQVLVGAGAGLVGAVTLYPQTFGLNSYKRIVAQYINDEEQPLDDRTKKLAEEVLVATNLTPEEEAIIEFFTVYGQETTHRGSCKLRSGAYVGLPATFAYQAINQVQTEKIQLNNKPVDWDSRPGELLLQSLVLSEKAKKFAIAREIQYTNTYHVTLETLFRSTFLITAYAAGFFVNNVFQLRRIMKRWGRGVVFTSISGAVYVLFVLLDDTYYCRRDLKVDMRAADVGPEYSEGGVEFYNRLLQRNMALRVLLGSEGSQLYTTYGNMVAGWRRPHATLTERRDLLATHLHQTCHKDSEDDKKSN